MTINHIITTSVVASAFIVGIIVGKSFDDSIFLQTNLELHDGITVTSYTSIENLTDSNPTVTASGKQTKNKIIAISRDMLSEYTHDATISFGDTVYVVIGPYIVEDTMNRRKILCADVWSPSLHVAKVFGKQFNCKLIKRR